jgi:hypothetical protein
VSARRRSAALAAAGLLLPAAAQAHSFGIVYNLPVPFWLYAWGATAALVASFLVVGYFVSSTGAGQRPAWSVDLSGSAGVRLARRLRLMALLKTLSVGGLLLCMVTGFAGTKSPYGNFNMTFFWIVFVLGFTYFTALAGDLYAAINPWKVITDGIARVLRGYGVGVVRYPERLGYWPAVGFYMAFIWIELFGRTVPFSLAVILALYSLINLAGAGLIGARDWFRYCELFSVFFRQIARMAPVDYVPADDRDGQHGRLRLRAPFAGLVEPPAERLSLLVFTLFMLSSTAFDGLRESVVWVKLFWVDVYEWIKPWAGANPIQAYPLLRQLFIAWQTSWLLLSPFAYLALYGVFVYLARLITRSAMPLRELALRFAHSLLPIVLVYNITHYYTLILTQGVKIVSLASDPLGRNWNLFGTARWLQRTIIPDAATVWHVQVGLIVFGHIVSVYLAHLVALRIFPTHRQAVLSQLPMLVLMVIFTTVGLWILSQPIKPGA